MHMKIKGAIDRSGPGVDTTTPWPALLDKQQREMDQAVAMLREAANQGHMNAQCICGCLYDFGWGVANDDHLALVYYEKAAEQGHVTCQHNAGSFYYEGQGCKQSYERAAGWLEKSALQGCTDAMSANGHLYVLGKGVPLDFERGFEWLKRAVSQGDIEAMSMLAYCHENGMGVAMDYMEARRLWTLTSAHGHTEATESVIRVDDKIRTECPLLGKRVMIIGKSRDLNGQVGVAHGL